MKILFLFLKEKTLNLIQKIKNKQQELMQYVRKQYKKYKIFIKIFLYFFICICILQLINSIRYHLMITKYYVMCQNYHEIIKKLEIAENEDKVKITVIKERVNALHKFLKQMYPGYDYNAKVDEALQNQDLISDLPTDLYKIYIDNFLIKNHGVQNYIKTLKNVSFPMEESSSFVGVKGAEFFQYRPYKKYNYHHEGFDIKNVYNNKIKAIYDSFVWKKYYSYEGGWTIEIKFEYENEEGKKDWYFARYRHLENVDNYVKEGTKLKKDDIIGNMGDTGIFATTPHCHIELWKWKDKKWQCINFVQNSTWNNKYIEKL